MIEVKYLCTLLMAPVKEVSKTTDYLLSTVRSNLPARIQIRYCRIPADNLIQDL